MAKPEVQKQEPMNQAIQVYRVYTKNSSFESNSLTKDLIDSRPMPKIDLQIHVGFDTKEDQSVEAILTLQLIAKHEEKILWRLQLQQAGLFMITGFKEDERKQIIHGFCMNMIYPYACETICDLVVRGGFEPVYLSPMNFDILYQEQLKKEKEQQKAEEKKPVTIQ